MNDSTSLKIGFILKNRVAIAGATFFDRSWVELEFPPVIRSSEYFYCSTACYVPQQSPQNVTVLNNPPAVESMLTRNLKEIQSARALTGLYRNQ